MGPKNPAVYIVVALFVLVIVVYLFINVIRAKGFIVKGLESNVDKYEEDALDTTKVLLNWAFGLLIGTITMMIIVIIFVSFSTSPAWNKWRVGSSYTVAFIVLIIIGVVGGLAVASYINITKYFGEEPVYWLIAARFFTWQIGVASLFGFILLAGSICVAGISQYNNSESGGINAGPGSSYGMSSVSDSPYGMSSGTYSMTPYDM